MPEARKVEAHLEACEPCTGELRSFQSARSGLLELREQDVEASGIWKALEPRLDVMDAARQLRRPWYRRASWLSAAAAALVLAALSPVLVQSFGSGAETPGGGTAVPQAQPIGHSDALSEQASAGGLNEVVPIEEVLEFWKRRPFSVEIRPEGEFGTLPNGLPYSSSATFAPDTTHSPPDQRF